MIRRHPSAETACPDTDTGLGRSIAGLRRARKFHQRDCCSALERCGVRMTPTALSRWENGSNLPGCYQLLALSHVLGEEGRIDGFFPEEAPGETFRSLPGTAANAYADFLLQRKARKTIRRRTQLIPFPVAENYASAGTGSLLEDDCFSMVPLPAFSIPPRASFAVRVSGDSMEPKYHSGQLIFVEKTVQLHDGETGVFSLNGEGYVKQYRERLLPPDPALDDFSGSGYPVRDISLVSLNPAYRPIHIHEGDALTVFGRVL
ncbi:MAG: LexA family transcriptional regulator [Clostridia bacterium]|nr:LexA family transcriptional regulator [Clostridia bacterium]